MIVLLASSALIIHPIVLLLCADALVGKGKIRMLLVFSLMLTFVTLDSNTLNNTVSLQPIVSERV